MNLSALADFNLVAVHGGIGRASRVSGRPKTSLSRRIAELEVELGVRLIDRGARALSLTEEGRALHQRTAGPLAEIAEAALDLRSGTSTPRGRLRISAPVVFAHIAMGRIAAEFNKLYPEVQMEIVSEDRLVNPVEEGYDVAIRVNPAPDENLVGRCFLRDDRLLVAAPGVPLPENGASVPAVVRNEASGARWRLIDGPELTPLPVLRLSSLLMVRDAVLAGTGVASLPRMVVEDDLRAGRLVCWGVLDQAPAEMWALHGSRRLVSARTRAFLNYLEQLYSKNS
jgi:DNA-binding transcriptional LysR family regulator